MENDVAKLKAEVRDLKATIEVLMKTVNREIGLSCDKLYTKDQFLGAVQRENKFWKDLLKDPDFKYGVLLGTNQTPMVRGEDYYRFLLKRKGRDEKNKGQDPEA